MGNIAKDPELRVLTLAGRSRFIARGGRSGAPEMVVHVISSTPSRTQAGNLMRYVARVRDGDEAHPRVPLFTGDGEVGLHQDMTFEDAKAGTRELFEALELEPESENVTREGKLKSPVLYHITASYPIVETERDIQVVEAGVSFSLGPQEIERQNERVEPYRHFEDRSQVPLPPADMPGTGQAFATDDGWLYQTVLPGLVDATRLDPAYRQELGETVDRLLPLMSQLLPQETRAGAARVTGALFLNDREDGDSYWRAEGVTIPLNQAGDVRFIPVVAMAADDAEKTLAHEALHVHVKEGRIRNAELEVFRNKLEELSQRYGLRDGFYSQEEQLEEAVAHLAGEWFGRETVKGGYQAGTADRDGRHFVGGQQAYRNDELNLEPEQIDFLLRFASGEIGSRESDPQIRLHHLQKMGLSGPEDERISTQYSLGPDGASGRQLLASEAVQTNYSLGIDQFDLDNQAFLDWFSDSQVVDRNGRPQIMFHGTADDFDEFADSKDVGFHFTTGEGAASAIALDRGESKDGGAQVIPVFLSIQNPYIIPDLNTFSAMALADQMHRDGLIDQDDFGGLLESWSEATVRFADWGDVLEWAKQHKGTDAVKAAGQALHQAGGAGRITAISEYAQALLETQRGHFRRLTHDFPGKAELKNAVVGRLEELGYDGLRYRNRFEGADQAYVAFKPSQIKSVSTDIHIGLIDTQNQTDDLIRREATQLYEYCMNQGHEEVAAIARHIADLPSPTASLLDQGMAPIRRLGDLAKSAYGKSAEVAQSIEAAAGDLEGHINFHLLKAKAEMDALFFEHADSLSVAADDAGLEAAANWINDVDRYSESPTDQVLNDLGETVSSISESGFVAQASDMVSHAWTKAGVYWTQAVDAVQNTLGIDPVQAAEQAGSVMYSLGSYEEENLSEPQVDLDELRGELFAIAKRINPNVNFATAERLFGEGADLIRSGSSSANRREVAGQYEPLKHLITVSEHVYLDAEAFTRAGAAGNLHQYYEPSALSELHRQLGAYLLHESEQGRIAPAEASGIRFTDGTAVVTPQSLQVDWEAYDQSLEKSAVQYSLGSHMDHMQANAQTRRFNALSENWDLTEKPDGQPPVMQLKGHDLAIEASGSSPNGRFVILEKELPVALSGELPSAVAEAHSRAGSDNAVRLMDVEKAEQSQEDVEKNGKIKAIADHLRSSIGMKAKDMPSPANDEMMSRTSLEEAANHGPEQDCCSDQECCEIAQYRPGSPGTRKAGPEDSGYA